jgi:hypothetical protein
MRLTLTAAIAAAALTASCASSYESRIAGRLYDVGLSRPMAHCMAERMVERLSTGQLRTIARFGRDLDDTSDMTVGELTRRFTRIGDPEIVEVVTRAGLGCAITS